MITTIIFDLGEVQIQGVYNVEHYLENVLGLKKSDIAKGLQIPEIKPLMYGQITEDEYWKAVIKKNHWNVDVKEFKTAIRKNFETVSGTREIIEQLKQKGFKLGLLSDHVKEWIEHCEDKFQYHDLFHSKLYSFEIEACKPDKKVFVEILKRLNEKPENCIFIDDAQINIDGAKKLGINTILFKNSVQLKKDLAAFSIFVD